MQQTKNSGKNFQNGLDALLGNDKASLFDQIAGSKDVEIEELEQILGGEVEPARLGNEELNLTNLFNNQEVELDLNDIDKVIQLKSDALRNYRKGDFIEALDKLENAIRIIPGDLDLLFYESLCLYQLGNVDRASKIFAELYSLDKTRSLPLLPKMYSLSLLKLEKFDSAEAFLITVLSEHKYDHQLQNMLGYALERQNKLEAAEKVYETILEEHPNNVNAANALAYVYYRQGKKLSDAMDLVKRALEKEPDNPAYLDTFGMLLHQKGNEDSARKALKKAIQLDPHNSEILTHINELFSV